MHVYKVCLKAKDGQFQSAVSAYILKYALGKWTRPDFGKIFAFDTPEASQDWISTLMRPAELGIYLATARKVYHPEDIHINIMADCWIVNDMIEFWEDDHVRFIPGKKVLPDGTIFCNAIKLVKEV